MKKLLIVYEHPGMGHLRMARIIEDAMKGAGEVEVVLAAGSALADDASVVVSTADGFNKVLGECCYVTANDRGSVRIVGHHRNEKAALIRGELGRLLAASVARAA